MPLHPQSSLIGVTGGKGGVGKSVFAANLALALQQEMRTSVLLVDLDPQSCGDQNIILGLRPQKTMQEICTYTGAISSQTVGSLLSRHSSGLSYIGAVRTPDEIHQVDPDLAIKQLEKLSQFYRYIVVDLGAHPSSDQMRIIAECTAVNVLTLPETLAVNQTHKLLNEMMAATLPAEMFQVIINKSTSMGLAPSAIGQSLRRPVLAALPQDDITVNQSIQKSTPFVLTHAKTPISAAYHDIARKLSSGLLQKLKTLSKPQALKLKDEPAQQKASANKQSALAGPERKLDSRTVLKMRVHTELIEAMDLKKGIADTQGDPSKEKALEQKTRQSISQIVDKEASGLSREERSRVIKEVLDEALNLGPLEDLLEDPKVTEIMVNGCDRIFVERSGKIQLTPITFTSNLQLRNVIERIVTPLGRRIDEKTPYVDARLKDGSRVNAVIEPLAIDGPAITIRKFSNDPITHDNYIGWNTCTQAMIDFLKICVENGLNVIISGGTGSGKTTLLNVLSGFIPSNERIITVEDAAELQLKQTHVVRLETRPANMEGSGAISIRDLVRNSLRMRPDRIVVGECRDGAALDMLSAMNTGHDGSMTTVHANNPREAVARLETLCMMAGMDLPARAIREQVASAVHLIVQISRLSDGSRKIINVTEVVGMQGETVTLQEIFKFKEEGFDKNRKIIGQFQAMGLIPTFIEKFEARGVVIPRHLFSNSAPEKSVPPKATPIGKANVKKAFATAKGFAPKAKKVGNGGNS